MHRSWSPSNSFSLDGRHRWGHSANPTAGSDGAPDVRARRRRRGPGAHQFHLPSSSMSDRDGLVVGDAAVIGLFDPREQEDAVVGGEPEGDREEQDRLCRVERARAPIGAI